MRSLALALSLVLVSCLPRVPRQRLSDNAAVAVAYVVDPAYAGSPTAPPQELKQALAKELDEHNLRAVEVALEVVASQRLTDARFDALKKASSGAPWLMLVELRVRYFSQIDARYRWQVSAQITVARADGVPVRDPFEIPVALMFDHEKENEAIISSAADVTKRAGLLLDGVLAGAK
jgi:hypothetical protein